MGNRFTRDEKRHPYQDRLDFWIERDEAYKHSSKKKNEENDAKKTEAEETEAEDLASLIIDGTEIDSSFITSAQKSSFPGENTDTGMSVGEILNSNKGTGQLLPENVKQPLEEQMNADLSTVHIHTDNTAQKLTEENNAIALTYGQDIYFSKGSFDPVTTNGLELLAHELMHTQQQDGDANKKIQKIEDESGLYPEPKGDLKNGVTVKVDASSDHENDLELTFIQSGKYLKIKAYNLWTKETTEYQKFDQLLIPFNHAELSFYDYEIYHGNINPLVTVLAIREAGDKNTANQLALKIYTRVDFEKTGEYHVMLTNGKKDQTLTFKFSPKKTSGQHNIVSVTDDIKDQTRPKIQATMGYYSDMLTFQLISGTMEGVELDDASKQYMQLDPEKKDRPNLYYLNVWMEDTVGNKVRHGPYPIFLKKDKISTQDFRVIKQTKLTLEIDADNDGISDLWIYQFSTPVPGIDYEKGDVSMYNDRYSYVKLHGPALLDEWKTARFRWLDGELYFTSHLSGGYDYFSYGDYMADTFLNQQDAEKLVDDKIAKMNLQINYYQAMAADRNIISKKTYHAWQDLSFGMTQLRLMMSGNYTEVLTVQNISVFKTIKHRIDTFFKYYNKETEEYTLPDVPFTDYGPSAEIEDNKYTGYHRHFVEGDITTWWKDIEIITSVEKNMNTHLEDFDFKELSKDFIDIGTRYQTWLVDQVGRAKATTKEDQQMQSTVANTVKYRNKLIELREKGTELTQVPAIFFPKENASRYNENTDISALYFPLEIFYWKEDGYWYIADLINLDKPFSSYTEVKDGEKHPPIQLFKDLDHKKHLPEGIIYYKMPDGEKYMVEVTGSTTWWEYLSYAAMALAGIGLIILTCGGAAPVVTGFFIASGVASIVSSTASAIDDYKHGQLDSKALGIYALEIITSLLQIKIGILGRFVNESAQVAKLTPMVRYANLVYMPLQTTAIVTEGLQFAVLAYDAALQIEAINNGPGSKEEKQRAVFILLSQLTVTGGFFILSAKGYKEEVDFHSKRNLTIDPDGNVNLGNKQLTHSTNGQQTYAKPLYLEGVDDTVRDHMHMILGRERGEEIDRFLQKHHKELAEELDKYGTEGVYHAINLSEEDHLLKKLEPDFSVKRTKDILRKSGGDLEDMQVISKNRKAIEESIDESGKFKDATTESDYQKYVKRKQNEGKEPRNRVDWKETRDYWMNDSPMARGNAFNEKAVKEEWYPYNEVHLENGKRVDSYLPPENGNKGKIVSRKATNLNEIELSTFEGYLKEMNKKYAPGTKINSKKYKKELKNQVLEGEMFLEIPDVNQNLPNIQEYINLAQSHGIQISFKPE